MHTSIAAACSGSRPYSPACRSMASATNLLIPLPFAAPAALLPVVARSAAACQADRYRKHFPATAHAVLLVFHGLSGAPSLRQSYPAFGGCPSLRRLSGHRHDSQLGSRRPHHGGQLRQRLHRQALDLLADL